VAHVLTVDKHPDADKLKLCSVDVGEATPLQIVCGAPNVAAGMKVPCARVGAKLPGIEIKKAKVRGVESHGMLCSARELGLSEDHGGLLPLAADAVVGSDIRKHLDLDDRRITIKLTPNRADCLSVLGIARELSALTGVPLSVPEISPVAAAIDDQRAIQLDAPTSCPRYCGRIVRGVNANVPTPEWMKRRIERSGIRSISFLVDVTNYVMLEIGQPLHAFDDAELAGTVHVRLPTPDEKLLLLNEQTVTPTADTALIADDEKPLAMAGIMGGEHSGISDSTRDLFLESAFFPAGGDRRQGARAGLFFRRLASLRARRRFRTAAPRHRTCDATDPGKLRRPARPGGRGRGARAPAAAPPGHAAQRPRGPRARHHVARRTHRGHAEEPGPAGGTPRRRLSRDAAEFSASTSRSRKT
jgi:phenylalanyl-tRNA synthetase beta chain